MVLALHVHGDKVTNIEVVFDETFREVPAPVKMGVPLFYKKLPGTGGDDSQIRSSAIVRFMADPDDGFAPMEWQYGGNRGPAPPVVLARRDKQPFSAHDWDVINEYISEWLEEACEADENRNAVNDRYLSPGALQAYVRTHREDNQAALLSLRFPLGSTVVPQGLSATELNGQEGTVEQYGRDRVGVRFPGLPERGVTALKPERLTLVQEAVLCQDAERAAKQQDTGDEKESQARREARKAEVERREMLQIAERFVECLYRDTFPEMDDLHLFGVGGHYTARAQEVLAVWQGAAKAGDISAQDLADALAKNTMRQLFEATCRRLADSRTWNSTYAKLVLEANFAACEFDSV